METTKVFPNYEKVIIEKSKEFTSMREVSFFNYKDEKVLELHITSRELNLLRKALNSKIK